MTSDEITDADSLRVWLEGQTREVAVTIAHRSAMRVAPLFWRKVAPSADKLDLTALETGRPILISQVAGVRPTPAIEDSANGYAASFGTVVTATSNAVAEAAAYVADAAVHVAAVDDDARAVAAAATTAAATGAARKFGEGAYGTGAYGGRKAVDEEDPAAIWEGVLQDTARLNGRETGQAAAAAPLWRDGQNPFDDDWQKVRTAWAATGDSGWHFWIEWYEAALAGHPLLGNWDRHWALLTDIALISDHDWNAGPETVNPLVAEIVERHQIVAEPRPPVQTILAAAQQNRYALALQLDALSELVEKGASGAQGWNTADEIEQAEKERQLDLFARLREAVDRLSGLLAQPGDITVNTAEEMASWTQVIAQTGKEWNSAAKEYVRRDPGPRLDLTARVVLGGSVAGVLTTLGLPMVGATAGSAIIGSKMVKDAIKGIKGD